MQMIMTLYDLTKKYSSGKGESVMWTTLEIVSDVVDEYVPEEAKDSLMRRVYGEIAGMHYNEEYAKADVKKMYYKDSQGNKHYGPYWTDDEIASVWDKVKGDVNGYNRWDMYVTMNMIKSDNCRLLDKWFPDEKKEERDRRLVDLSLNWLKDEDNPFGDGKVWCYING